MATISVGDVFRTNEGFDVLVVSVVHSKEIIVEFQDLNKHRATVTSGNLRAGSIKNPYKVISCGYGFMGSGKYIARSGNNIMPEYSAWNSMMKRCYGDATQVSRPTYIGCTVADEWHNFQNFADWYTNQQFYGKGYHLDKDVLVKGNKVYSPETCCLIPQDINALINKNLKSRGEYPIGVSYHKTKKKYIASISKCSKIFEIGTFDSPELAAQAYTSEKENHVREVANYWRNSIDEPVFFALTRWRV